MRRVSNFQPRQRVTSSLTMLVLNSLKMAKTSSQTEDVSTCLSQQQTPSKMAKTSSTTNSTNKTQKASSIETTLVARLTNNCQPYGRKSASESRANEPTISHCCEKTDMDFISQSFRETRKTLRLPSLGMRHLWWSAAVPHNLRRLSKRKKKEKL